MNRGGILLLVVQEDKRHLELESGDPERHLITEAIAAKVSVQPCPSPRHSGSSCLGIVRFQKETNIMADDHSRAIKCNSSYPRHAYDGGSSYLKSSGTIVTMWTGQFDLSNRKISPEWRRAARRGHMPVRNLLMVFLPALPRS